MVTRHVRLGDAEALLALHRSQSLGSRLLEEAESWAAKTGIRRLELTVMAHNARAIHLYEKAGFVREGIRKLLGALPDEIPLGT